MYCQFYKLSNNDDYNDNEDDDDDDEDEDICLCYMRSVFVLQKWMNVCLCHVCTLATVKIKSMDTDVHVYRDSLAKIVKSVSNNFSIQLI